MTDEQLPPTNAAQRGMVRCAAAAALFGATIPLAGRLADDTSAPVLAGLLYLGAALAVAPIAARRFDPSSMRRGVGRLALAVITGGLLGPLLLVAGLARTPAATASLLLNLELVATTLFAVVFFREHLGGRVLTGAAAVVVAGLALVWTDAPDLRLGAVFIVGACLCWGLDNCVTAGLGEVSPHHITLAKGVIAGTTNLVLGLALGASLPPAGVLVAALAIGAVGYGVSITLWVSGARDLGAARGQLVFSAAPFVGVLIAWLVFQDPVRPAEVLAVAIAAFGVSRVLGSDHEHPHRHRAVEHDHEHDHDDGHHDHTHDTTREGSGRHAHHHRHDELVHAHPHVPDLHHRHDHDSDE